MSQLIHLGDPTNHQARDQIKFYSPDSAYAYTVEVYHPIHALNLREHWQRENYKLMDRLLKKLLEAYASHKQGGEDHSSTKMLARQSSLVVLFTEMLESGVAISVESSGGVSVGGRE